MTMQVVARINVWTEHGREEDVRVVREADALAAIKAARVQALSGVEVCEEFDALSKRVNWNTLSSVNAAWHAFKCAIKFSERRLLGEDAGKP